MTVEALRRGRPEALADLLEQYGSLLQGVAFLILRDHAAAEDVVAETLLTAFERRNQLRDPDALRAWLLRIATNRAIGRRRQRARVVQIDVVKEVFASSGSLTPDDQATLGQAVARLPPRMRAAVVLHYYADLPVEGVAEAMGISTNTVKTQLRAALGHLRLALAEQPLSLSEEHHARA